MFPWKQQLSQKVLPIHKLIAGNVYISTGGASYKSRAFLMKLLQTVQEECARIRQRLCHHHHQDPQREQEQEQERSTIVLAHAFADPCYNRSSFHLAGTSEAVAQVSSLIARLALQHDNEENYRKSNSNYGSTNSTAHPYVGFVDHIAFMPLLLPQNNEAVSLFLQNQALLDNHNSNKNNNTTNIGIDPHQQHHSCSQAAKYVGEYLSKDMGCVVHYYGSASVDNAPLSKVRKERTTFFQSGSLASSQPLPLLTTTSICSSTVSSTTSRSGSDNNNEKPIVTCVGSPFNFVENFNVRLSAKEANTDTTTTSTTTAFTSSTVASIGKRGAMSLCRTLRERDGGLEGVEALTLPYDDSTSSTASISSSCDGKSSTSGSTWEVACNLLSPYNSMGKSRKEDICQKTMEWLLQYNTNNPNNSITIEDMYSVGTTQEQCLNCLLLVLLEDMEEPTAAIYTHDETISNQFKTYLHKK